jgi:hypothetical protein
MKWILLIALLLAGSTGCTAYYTKPGATTTDFNRDKAYCEKVAKQEAARKGTKPCDEVDRCLINMKGWRRD